MLLKQQIDGDLSSIPPSTFCISNDLLFSTVGESWPAHEHYRLDHIYIYIFIYILYILYIYLYIHKWLWPAPLQPIPLNAYNVRHWLYRAEVGSGDGSYIEISLPTGAGGVGEQFRRPAYLSLSLSLCGLRGLRGEFRGRGGGGGWVRELWRELCADVLQILLLLLAPCPCMTTTLDSPYLLWRRGGKGVAVGWLTFVGHI